MVYNTKAAEMAARIDPHSSLYEQRGPRAERLAVGGRNWTVPHMMSEGAWCLRYELMSEVARCLRYCWRLPAVAHGFWRLLAVAVGGCWPPLAALRGYD